MSYGMVVVLGRGCDYGAETLPRISLTAEVLGRGDGVALGDS